MRIPQRKGIKTCSKQDVLRDSTGNSSSETILGKPTSRNQPRTKRDGVRPICTARRARQLCHGVGAKNGHCKGIGKD